MRGYLRALSEADFRRLFIGATASSLGDGMSFVALAWLVVSRPHGTTQLGLLVACYTGPVFIGGWLAGAVLDRFDKRHVIAADSIVRGLAFAAIPAVQFLGLRLDWLVFAVAALYGLFKMVPLAGFPSAIPDMVGDANLDAANALEGLSYGLAGIIGPAVAGILIALIGAANVVLVDALSYFIFAGAALGIRRPLRPSEAASVPRTSFPQVLRLLITDMPIASTTLAFMTFNVAEGMLMVTGPWLARERLGGAAALGLLFSALSAGELGGSFAAGAWSAKRALPAIGGSALLASIGLLGLYATVRPVVALGYAVVGFFSAPMTVWAQSMRMRRLPADVRGRAFASLRTLMQATPPLGAGLATPLLASGNLPAAIATMAVLIALPAVGLIAIGLAMPSPIAAEVRP